MANSKWKDFERDIHAIYAQYAVAGTTVEHDVKILGSDSKAARQIDVLIRTSVSSPFGEHPNLIAIECKDKKRPIDVQGISEFAIKIKDVHANKGIMLSTSGYTQAALNMAQSYGITTFKFNELTEDQLNELKKFCITAIYKKVGWRVAGLLIQNEEKQSNFAIDHYSVIYQEDGTEIGAIYSLVEQRMNMGEVPGTHGKHLIDFGIVCMIVDGELRRLIVQVEIDITIRCFLGYFPYLRTYIRDVHKDEIVVNLLRTPHISIKPWEIPQPEWTEVPSLQGMAIQPSVELKEGPKWAFR